MYNLPALRSNPERRDWQEALISHMQGCYVALTEVYGGHPSAAVPT